MAEPSEDLAKAPQNLTVGLNANLCQIRGLLSFKSNDLLSATDRKAISFGIRHQANQLVSSIQHRPFVCASILYPRDREPSFSEDHFDSLRRVNLQYPAETTPSIAN
jgi:hypothetical protein